MFDVVVVGGGFAGITAARETALRGASTLLLEARDRLGGRTWTAPWQGLDIELGGGWVHWHQPHTWSEIVRAGLEVEIGEETEVAAWYVGEERRAGTIAERDAIAARGWDAFVAGVEEMLPLPHDPLARVDRLARLDRMSIAERMDELDLTQEERDVLAAELESLASGPLSESGAVSVLRWHALSGYSLALTQYTGGRVTLVRGTGALLAAIAGGATFETRLDAPVAAISQSETAVEVRLRDGETVAARSAVVALPLNALPAVEFDPPLSAGKRAAIAAGQASTGGKIFIRARGPAVQQNAIRPGHPFGYLATEYLLPDGEQVMIGFGTDGRTCDAGDLASVQRRLDDIIPGYKVVAATANDWVGQEFSRGTWAIHRPGWYTTHHANARLPEGRIVFAGSDIANGWSGFIDGAIESGFRGAALALDAITGHRRAA
ncbi:MAG TPA: NAD(P)/FAD-dependent oxidoreductase [Gaiellales bacterium]